MRIPKDLRWQPTGRTLGEGGQAQVLLVSDKERDDSVVYALKALRRNEHSQAYERFYREIEAIRKLDHPYIIKVFDHSKPDDEFHYYVMEYVEGARTLDKVIRSQGNPYYGNSLKALSLFEQISLAIVECESCSPMIVHRDLSPSNVLILPDLSIKIIDFGVCQIEGQNTITLVDEGVGTINYMAPECESGSEERIGIDADLYSAGKILWSAITGQRAFSRESPVFNGKTMSDMFPDDPTTLHLHHIFEKTIRRDCRERWASAELAVSAARDVQYLIHSGYSPLEKILVKCPICGVGELTDFQGGHTVFGNPNPQGVRSRQCSYCGICFAINYRKIQDTLNNRKSLE